MADNIIRFFESDIKIGRIVVKIAQIENPEVLFNNLLSRPADDEDLQDERMPYWCDLWPSAIALAEYIEKNPEVVRGKTVLEIGCGMALPGITAAMNGGDVTLTDYLPDALEYAGHNWKLNLKSKAKLKILDWRKPEGFEPADVLLASDVVYESRSFRPVIKAFKHLVKKDGVIILTEPNRKFSKDFFTQLNKKHFTISKEDKAVEKDGVNYVISVWRIVREE